MTQGEGSALDVEDLSVAIVGAGWIAQGAHLPAWRATRGATVKWVVDQDAARAEALARTFGVEHWTTELERVLEDDELVAVDICTPPAPHREIVTRALRCGKHVLVEKPFVVDLSDASALMREVKERPGLVCMVAENWPYSSAGRAVLEEVRSGHIGEVFLVKGSHESSLYAYDGPLPQSLSLESNAGGTTMTAGIHVINLVREVVGDFETVSAYGLERAEPGALVDTSMVVSFRSTTGVLGIFDFTGTSRRVGSRKLLVTVFGTQGTIDADVLSGEYTLSLAARATHRSSEYPLLEVAGEVRVQREQAPSMGFKEEVAAFCAAVREGRDMSEELRGHSATLAAVLAIYRSSAEGSPVSPGELLADAGIEVGGWARGRSVRA